MSKPHYRLRTDGTMLSAIRAADGFQNLVANLGTSRDKAYANGYFLDIIDRQRLSTAYRTSAVAKSIVDIPADDSCREWREWQAEEDQISALEAEEKRLGVQAKVRDARKRARLYGGAAIFIGTGDSNLELPLNPRSVQRGGLRYLTVLDLWELTAGELSMDPRDPNYGMPKHYELHAVEASAIRIHPSRLVIFRGADVLDSITRQSMQGWGDSELQAAYERITQLDGTMANIASLIFEAKVDVVKIQNFTNDLRSGGSAYETLMLKRFGLAATAKGINGMLMLDGEEEYDQKSASFSTLPELADRFMQMVAAAARIPMTRLFGMSPAGMNATGESDIRTYYDSVRQEQTLDMEPAMAVMDECLVRSALGDRPEDVHFNWRSLWQMSEKERAEVADKLTTAAERVSRIDAAPHEAISEALVNALTEVGAFPGLDQAVKEFGGTPEREERIDPLTGDPVAPKKGEEEA